MEYTAKRLDETTYRLYVRRILLAGLMAGVFSMWGLVRPNNWDGYQACGILRDDLEYKMDDDDCGKPDYGYICGHIRTSIVIQSHM